MKRPYTKRQIEESIAFWSRLLEENGGLPDFLYHSTPAKNAAKIEREGVNPGGEVQWRKLSKKGVTYWACGKMQAALYVRMKGYRREDIATYRVPISAFDTGRLRPDRNYPDPEKSGAFEYEGSIPPEYLVRDDF